MSRLEAELDSLRDRYSSTNEEMAITNDDRVRLTEQVDQLKQQLQKANDEKNAAQRTTMKQVCFCDVIYKVRLSKKSKHENCNFLEMREHFCTKFFSFVQLITVHK